MAGLAVDATEGGIREIDNLAGRDDMSGFLLLR